MPWPSQDSGLKLIQNLWRDLKRAFHAHKVCCVAALKQSRKNQWGEIIRYQSYQRWVGAVVAAKGGTMNYAVLGRRSYFSHWWLKLRFGTVYYDLHANKSYSLSALLHCFYSHIHLEQQKYLYHMSPVNVHPATN